MSDPSWNVILLPFGPGCTILSVGAVVGQTDITQYVKSASIKIGRRGSFDHIASVGLCTLTLRNDQHTLPTLPVMQPVLVTVTHLGATFVVFQGFIKTIRPESGTTRKREVVVDAVDSLGILQNRKINVPLQLNRSGDYLVAGIMNIAFNKPSNSVILTFLATPAAGVSVNIAGYTYTFTNTYPATAPYSVLARSASDAGVNLAAAINGIDGLNTLYGANTAIGSSIVAAWYGTYLQLSAAMPGTRPAFTVSSSVPAVVAVAPVSGIANGGNDLAFLQLDAGVQAFPIAGHGWAYNHTSALSAIEEVCKGEDSYFYQQSTGRITWRNRNFKFLNLITTPKFTTHSEPVLTAQTSLDNIYNQINVTITPHDTLVAGVIGRIVGGFDVPGNGKRTVHVPFVDPITGQPCGAQTLVLPLRPYTDWVANERRDLLGGDYTGSQYLKMSYVISGAGIDVTISNYATGVLFFTKFQVNGQGLVHYNPIVSSAIDKASIISTGVQHDLAVELSLSEDVAYGNSLATYLLSKWKTPTLRVSTVDYGNINVIGGVSVIAVKIDDVVVLNDTQIGLSNKKYAVLGINFELAPQSIKVSHQVEPLDDVTYWLLGDATYGVLNSTARLAV